MSDSLVNVESDEEGALKKKAADIWGRARTNAFANKEAMNSLRTRSNWIYGISVFFILIPILINSILIAFYQNVDKGIVESTQVECTLCNSNREEPESTSTPNKTTEPAEDIDFVLWITIAVSLCNTIVLGCTFMIERTRWSEKSVEHGKFLAGYQQIAQRIRRLDLDKFTHIEIEEARLILSTQEENFELWKSIGVEPTHKHFLRAQEKMRQLKNYPFGLSSADFD